MKLIATIAATAALALTAGAASAQTYVKGSIGSEAHGLNHVEVKSYNAGVGYDFGTWRVEAEATSLGDVNTRDADLTVYSANVYYDFKPVFGLEPYAGVGYGIGDLSGSGFRGDNNDRVFVGTLGVAHSISDNLALTAEYRHFTSDKLTVRKPEGRAADLSANVVNVGVRYTF